MKRMTGADSFFLAMETPAWHQHVGSLNILEPGDRPVTFDDVVGALAQRIEFAPKFRWKLKTMPLGLDRPVWVDDAEFDVGRHVHRIAVPSPGGARETAEVAGMILSSPLDRRRPLWELWFLEGLAGGRAATVMKIHHCLLDGVSGALLATVLLDVEPDATGPLVPLPPPEERVAGPEPSAVEVVAHTVSEVVRRPLRFGRFVVSGAQKLGVGLAAGRDGPAIVLGAPRTPFNAPVGPRRALSFSSISLDDVKALSVHHGVKVNDVLLAVMSGVLRGYLLDLDLLPDAPLTCAVPVSTRAAGDTSLGNQVSAMFIPLPTNLADPVERLMAAHTASANAKAVHKTMSAHATPSLGDVASPLVLSSVLEAMYRTRLWSRVPVRVNTILSNIAGPPVPLYSCGARVTGLFPCSVLVEGMGLNTTVLTNMDRVDFGFHVDPDLVPDPWAVADAVPRALAELKAASGLGPPTPVRDPFGNETADATTVGMPT